MRFSAPEAAYIHIPFCAAKCGYCDFNSYAGLMALAPDYVDALCRQISATGPSDIPLKSVFFGGGTPSILQASHLRRILAALGEQFALDSSAEITMEANPESATAAKLEAAREMGFNRLSMGAQAFRDDLLQSLDRVHSHVTFLRAYNDARQVGFDNLSFDLMFALPGQTLKDWEETIQRAIELQPDHLSAYCLTLEEGTRFWELAARGDLVEADESLQAEMFLMCREMLTRAGYEHYEISNYALPDKRCRHNLVYWHNAPYYGFGTGAVSFTNGCRVKWETDPTSYVRQIQLTGYPEKSEAEEVSPETRLGESMMLGLRTADGVSLRRLSDDTGIDAETIYADTVTRHVQDGLLEKNGDSVRLTEKGLLLANEVAASFLL